MKVLLLTYFADQQTGLYLAEAFQEFSSNVHGVDIRQIMLELGQSKFEETLFSELDEIDMKPDIVLFTKALEIRKEVLNKIKDRYPKAKFVNWMFDVYVGDVPVWKNETYMEFVKEFDYYFCSLKGVADKLKEKGLDNIYFLPEACSPEAHKDTYVNHYQKQKYGEDIAFIGSLGYMMQHPKRIPILQKIIKEGFHIKIWGDVVSDWKHIPVEIRAKHMQTSVVNINHSKVVQSSLINLGIDQRPELSLSQSARMYRVMCAGGLYLTTHVKDLETMFRINKKNEMPTGEEELVVYYNDNDLIDLLDYLLEHDKIRNQIASNGQKAVLENHTFTDRIAEMLDIMKIKR